MTNLEAKQEAIKKAYGEYWEKLEYFINKDGWAYNYFEEIGIEIFGSEADFKNSIFWRPKSLQGIENNNGWIKIESEADLPKEGMHHSILLDSECINGYRNYDVIVFYEVNSRFRKKEISHYQPIEFQKPPIF